MMEIQDSFPLSSLSSVKNPPALIFSKVQEKSELQISGPPAAFRHVREKFRSEGRKSDIQLKLEQKRFTFLNDGIFKKYEEEIIKFFDGFSQTKTPPKLVTARLLDAFEKAEKSGDEKSVLENIKILRKITCIPKNEAFLQEIVLSKLMNFLELYLEFPFVAKEEMETEILWIYINLTTLSQKKNTLLDFSGLISKVMKRLGSISDQNKIEMIFWFFYNLSVDNLVYKKKLLENGVVNNILRVWSELMLSETCRQNLMELVLVLCHQKSVYAQFHSEILKLFPIIEANFSESSSDLANILWILKYLTDFDTKTFDKILCMTNFDSILKLLLSQNPKLAYVSLKIINNILSGENHHIQFLMQRNILGIFQKLIQSTKPEIRREVCFGVSNISAAEKPQIDALFKSDLLNEIINLAFIDDISVKMEVGVVLSNLSFFGDQKQKIGLVNRGMFEIWADLLSQFHNQEDMLICRILEGLECMLLLGYELETSLGVNAIKPCVENNGITRILDSMQDHPNEKIYKICFRILDRFFSES